MLEVKQLTRHYGDFVAVDNIDFAINKGEIVGLLGHNGAGKTTIMKMLSGYLEPTVGAISINDIDVVSDPVTAQSQLGYLPENLPVYPEMSVAEYLDYAADLKGITGDAKPLAIARALKATTLNDRILSPISTLSRGLKQRVGVAQAILGNPKVLILDEPTNGLDPSQTEQMRALIKDIAREATVILSTHIMQEVEAICDRVLIIDRGLLAIDASLQSLQTSSSIILKTDLTTLDATALLNDIDGIAHIEALADSHNQHQYRLTAAAAFQNNKKLDALVAKIAKTCVDAQASIFGLEKESRDLETLFREVAQNNRQSEEKPHAA